MNFEGHSYVENVNESGGGGGGSDIDLSDILARLTELEGKTKNIQNTVDDVTNVNGYIVQNPTRALISTANDSRIGTGELADKFYVNRRAAVGSYVSIIENAMSFDAGTTPILFPFLYEDQGQGLSFNGGVISTSMNGIYLVTLEVVLSNFTSLAALVVECQGMTWKHSITDIFDNTNEVSATFTSMFVVFTPQPFNVSIVSTSTGTIVKRKIAVARLSQVSYNA